MTEGTPIKILLSQIDISPLNYRRVYDPIALQKFADTLHRLGIISPVMVRKMPSGRFQLVVGERRFRAGKLAKLKEIPAIVRVLTDEQVIEIQLAENLQRENPHPLHESQAVALMMHANNSIPEIALRLGKSESFVYSRIKLSELIVPLQEIFLADIINIKDALEIAALATESQQEFYNDYCSNWQKKNFQLTDVKYKVSRFRYDLKRAPFDIKDKTLIPDAGACGRCPFNSATLKSLFPELAKEATCSHKVCFKSKCLAHAENSIRQLIVTQIPDAILTSGNISEENQIIIDSLPETSGLPAYSSYDVTLVTPPCVPDKADYTDSYDDEQEAFDEDGYNQALQEYQTDLEEQDELINSEKLRYGLYVQRDKITMVRFNPEKSGNNSNSITAKEVQQAIKDGSVTVDLLEKEIERIRTKEIRAKVIDRNRVQEKIHEDFVTNIKESVEMPKLTQEDLIAARLMVYQSLNYEVKSRIDNRFFAGLGWNDHSAFKEKLTQLTDEQYSFLIRSAIGGNSESKIPENLTGIIFRQVAAAAGQNLDTIENAQQEKATIRQSKLELRIAELEKRIEQLKTKV